MGGCRSWRSVVHHGLLASLDRRKARARGVWPSVGSEWDIECWTILVWTSGRRERQRRRQRRSEGEGKGKGGSGRNRREQHVKSRSDNSLPVAKGNDGLEEGRKSASSLAPAGASSPEKPVGMEVLFVEDNVINRKVGKRLVERLGHSVDVACDGGEALDMLRQEEKVYDIVFMDISMPVYRGTEVTELFREWEAELMAPRPEAQVHANLCFDRKRNGG